jgi:hypothetical protein
MAALKASAHPACDAWFDWRDDQDDAAPGDRRGDRDVGE